MSEKITDSILESHYSPTAMMVVYQNGHLDSYLECHAIGEDGLPGEARPVTKGFISDMLHHFSDTVSHTPHGVMPPSMLLADTRPGKERYVWWEGPRKRMQYFAESLNLQDGEYPMPGVVYDVKDSSLRIYAFKGAKPTMRTQLLEGPFFNVTVGSVCLGSAKADRPADLTWEAMQAYWQKMFWGSVNVHLGSNPLKEDKVNPARGNLVLVLKDCLGKDSFDANLLKPIRGLTLSKLLNK